MTYSHPRRSPTFCLRVLTKSFVNNPCADPTLDSSVYPSPRSVFVFGRGPEALPSRDAVVTHPHGSTPESSKLFRKTSVVYEPVSNFPNHSHSDRLFDPSHNVGFPCRTRFVSPRCPVRPVPVLTSTSPSKCPLLCLPPPWYSRRDPSVLETTDDLWGPGGDRDVQDHRP